MKNSKIRYDGPQITKVTPLKDELTETVTAHRITVTFIIHGITHYESWMSKDEYPVTVQADVTLMPREGGQPDLHAAVEKARAEIGARLTAAAALFEPDA